MKADPPIDDRRAAVVAIGIGASVVILVAVVVLGVLGTEVDRIGNSVTISIAGERRAMSRIAWLVTSAL